MTFTKKLQDISKTDIKIAGGKGASLGEMTQTGMPVPEGFIILSDAFNKFIEETDLNIEIDAALDEVNIDIIHTTENTSEKIQAMILSKEIPEEIKNDILKNFQEMDSEYVAVRSSATSEDSASAAWAGQLDSFLNTTKDTLLKNIKRCWASLFTPRAIFYRFEKSMDKDKISVAIVVQKMIQSEKSGIAFSVHPVTQDENQIIIEAGFGLGEAVVSGAITPDNYIIDKQGLNIIDINVNEQKKVLQKKENGGNEWLFIKDQGKEQVLSEKDIIELSELTIKIENHYGFPCDIEWAKEKNKFYILQCRPITTLVSKKECPAIEWFRFGQKKGSLLSREISSKHSFSRPYTTAIKDFLYTVDNYKYINWNHYVDKKELDHNLNKILNYAIKLKSVSSLKTQSDSALKKILKIYEGLNLDNCTDEYLLAKFLEFVDCDAKIESFVPPGNYIVRVLSLEVEKILKHKFPDKGISDITRMGNILGFNEKETDFSIRQKEILKSLIKNNRDDAYDSWKKYQWMNIMFLTYKKELMKNFEEEISTIKNPEEELLRIQENIEKNIIQQKEILKSSDFTEKELLIFNLLKESTYVELEVVKNLQIFQFRSIPLLEKIAEKLKITYNQLIYMTIDEIKKGIMNNTFPSIEEINRRIKEGFSIFRINQETSINLDSISQDLTGHNIETIKGISVSKGCFKGKVKIIMDISEINKINEGEILVTTMTTPNFIIGIRKAKAIITNDGGMTCHAAIISRELNIPCIVGTLNATDILKDEDLVEVDANNGIIKILKKSKKQISH